jgi:pimeloyl-ACP methyl ester carboxylesterase
MRRVATVLLCLAVLVAAAAALGPLAISLREPDDGRVLPPGVTGRLLDVGGHRVHVVERGTGPALVVIHGFGGSTVDFEEIVLEPLSRRHRVIAIDLYGFGWSERSDDFAYGWTLWSEEVAGVLDALGVARASVLGHSMCGAVAAVLAARHPDRVDRLILADALYPQEPDEAPLVFRGLRTPVLGELMLGMVSDGSAPGFSAVHAERAGAWYRGGVSGDRSADARAPRNGGPFRAVRVDGARRAGHPPGERRHARGRALPVPRRRRCVRAGDGGLPRGAADRR